MVCASVPEDNQRVLAVWLGLGGMGENNQYSLRSRVKRRKLPFFILHVPKLLICLFYVEAMQLYTRAGGGGGGALTI